MDEKDDDNYRPPFHWGDFGALVLAGGFSLFGLYLIVDMMTGGHPLAILFQKPKDPPTVQRPLTADEIRKLPFHALPGEVVLSTNAPLPGMGAAQVFPQIHDIGSLRIKLQRSMCLGTCPAYSVEISGDGKVSYRGENCVAQKGVRSARIPATDVAALVGKFRDAGYFSLRDRYAAPETDFPTSVTTIGFDGKSKSVLNYAGGLVGMPKAVGEIEMAIDKTAGTDRWIFGGTRYCGSVPVKEPRRP